MDCSICFEEILEDDLFKSSCNHNFHIKCLNKWIEELRNKNSDFYTCPLCRNNITEEFKLIKYWEGTNIIKFYRNKDIEIRNYPNGSIKYKIYLDDNDNVISGDFFSKNKTYRYTFDNKFLMKNININNIRKNDNININ